VNGFREETPSNSALRIQIKKRYRYQMILRTSVTIQAVRPLRFDIDHGKTLNEIWLCVICFVAKFRRSYVTICMGVLKLDGSGLSEVRLIYMYAKLQLPSLIAIS
jgi:hypothetical protein